MKEITPKQRKPIEPKPHLAFKPSFLDVKLKEQYLDPHFKEKLKEMWAREDAKNNQQNSIINHFMHPFIKASKNTQMKRSLVSQHVSPISSSSMNSPNSGEDLNRSSSMHNMHISYLNLDKKDKTSQKAFTKTFFNKSPGPTNSETMVISGVRPRQESPIIRNGKLFRSRDVGESKASFYINPQTTDRKETLKQENYDILQPINVRCFDSEIIPKSKSQNFTIKEVLTYISTQQKKRFKY
ncbi:unnamed protein product [Blepharisma stoltei]|uniref:Uncharacterized protein n=1 Tax=Blepharisma stoltei TaxID=1481888 RepID=A0AAU9IR65_9CILI|nr:unnamed protein product [Blepharisma stoltei]